jgi:hypothetical protein
MRPVGTQSRFTTPWYGDFFQFFQPFQLSGLITTFQLFQLSEFITAPLQWIAFRKSHLALRWQGDCHVHEGLLS